MVGVSGREAGRDDEEEEEEKRNLKNRLSCVVDVVELPAEGGGDASGWEVEEPGTGE